MSPCAQPAPNLTTASDLFALAYGRRNEGRFKCHWCSAPCADAWRHDGTPALPFVKSPEPTRCPAEHYVCQGCWLYRRERVTAVFLGGGLRDRQAYKNHSWLLTAEGAWALRPSSFESLFQHLLHPPAAFSLSLLDGASPPPNYLQLALVNNRLAARADTPLHFTLNNIKHTYTVYELESAAKAGDGAGRTPGTRALWDYLGQPRLKAEEEKKREGAGRPASAEQSLAVERQRLKRPVGDGSGAKIISKSG